MAPGPVNFSNFSKVEPRYGKGEEKGVNALEVIQTRMDHFLIQ